MTYQVIISASAQADIAAFADYAADYSDEFAVEQFQKLNRILSETLAKTPTTWSTFYVTGAPYRAYLFRVGRRTQYWLVHTVAEATKTVSLLRFWNARRDDAAFEL